MPGSHLPERVCPYPAVQRAGGRVHDAAPGQADPVAGADGADRDPVPQGGGVLCVLERDPVGEVRQGRPEDRRDAATYRDAGRDREVRGGRGRGLAGVPAGLVRLPARYEGRGPAVHIRQGRPQGDLLLLLPVGRGLRTGVHQGLRLLPLPGQDLGQRARVGQAAGAQGRHRLHRAVQRVRVLRGPRGAAGHLRPVPGRHHRGVRPAVAAPHPHALQHGRPGRRLLVGMLDAAGRGLPHHRLRRALPGPAVLRGAHRRQPRPRPPGERRDHLRPAGPRGHPRHLPHRDRPPGHRPRRQGRRRERLLQALAGQAVPQGRPGAADRDRHQLPPQSAYVRGNVCKVVPEVHRLASRMSWTWSAA